MTPEVQQLDERLFLVTVDERQLSVAAADICRPLPVSFPQITLEDMREQLRIIEWNMMGQAKSAILADTHVGECLRTLPKRSNIKHKVITHDGKLGFTVKFREKSHAIFFKLAVI